MRKREAHGARHAAAHVRSFILSALGTAFAFGCGDDAGAPGAGSNGGADGGGLTMEDGGSDAGPLGDAGPPGEDAGDASEPRAISQCEGDLLTFDAARYRGPIFDAAIEGDRVHLVYLTASCLGSSDDNVAQGLTYVTFETRGEASDPQGIVNTATEDCWITRSPALAAHAGQVSLFYTTNRTGSYELFFADLTGQTSPVRQTTDDDNELGAAAAVLGPDALAMAAYANVPPQVEPAAAAIVTKQPGKVESEVLSASEGHHPTQLSLAAVGGDAPLGAVAWLSEHAGGEGIYLRFVDELGSGVGQTFTLSPHLGGTSNVALATRAEGGAVVYTESAGGSVHELRFRTLDPSASVGQAQRLTSGNQNVRDAAIAAYANGYVVAYRRLGGATGTSMRLAFVDEYGNRGGDLIAAPAANDGSGAQVLVASDGRIVLLWVDVEAASDPGAAERLVKVRAARLTCL